MRAAATDRRCRGSVHWCRSTVSSCPAEREPGRPDGHHPVVVLARLLGTRSVRVCVMKPAGLVRQDEIQLAAGPRRGGVRPALTNTHVAVIGRPTRRGLYGASRTQATRGQSPAPLDDQEAERLIRAVLDKIELAPHRLDGTAPSLVYATALMTNRSFPINGDLAHRHRFPSGRTRLRCERLRPCRGRRVG